MSIATALFFKSADNPPLMPAIVKNIAKLVLRIGRCRPDN